MLHYVYMCIVTLKVMKNQSGSPSFGIRGKSMCIFVLYSHHSILFGFKSSFAFNFCIWLKPTHKLRIV